MAESIQSSREQQLAELLTRLVDRLAIDPHLELDEACRQYPEFEADLRELWGTIAVTRVAGSNRGETIDFVPDAPPSPGPSLTLPYDLGKYVLDEELGRGGMGIVYRATCKSDQSVVAIKMILTGTFASELELKRFRAEAQAAAKLDHPNIVPIYEIAEHHGVPYYCMKYIAGQTLAQRLIAGPLPTRRAAAMAIKICDAIQFAHQNQVLHRDIKPSNILVDEDGEPFIVDFGLAKEQSNAMQLTNTGAVLGTPSYMSPEQAAGARGQIDAASDIYALSAVLYHMITGRPPFLGETPVDTMFMVIEQDPINPRALNHRIHRDLEVIVLRGLQKPKDLRYRSAHSLANDLNNFLEGKSVTAREGRFGQVIGNLMRETHHAGVLENWGVLWMWHSLVLFVASIVTHYVYASGTTGGLFYLLLWTSGLAIWAAVFWWLRRRMGPVMFVERQIAHVWAGGMCLVFFIYPIELALGLKPLDLAPFLAVIAGMTFVVKAGILSGMFYINAIMLFLCAIAMIVKPDCGMVFFGTISAACFFLPGLKYYRRRKQGLLSRSGADDS